MTTDFGTRTDDFEPFAAPAATIGVPPGSEEPPLEVAALPLGRGLRRRPLMYALTALVIAVLAVVWSEPRLLFLAVGCGIGSAVAVFRPDRPETFLVYVSDLVAVAVIVSLVGLDPTLSPAVWVGTLVSGFFSLGQRAGHRLAVVSALVFLAAALWADEIALVELSEGQRLVTGIVAVAMGFVYLLLVLPFVSGAMRDAVAAADEVAEVRRQEAEFRASLASTVAHELRTPIAGIKGFVSLLQSDPGLSENDRSEFLEIISSQAGSLGAIVEDLLLAVQEEKSQMGVDAVRFDIFEAVGRTIREMSPTIAADVTFRAGHGMDVVGDPLRVGQILRNLITNAEKYGGDRIAVGIESRGPMARIVVADDGAGIPDADVERVFEPFERNVGGSEGYGLGLPISRTLAQAMNGDLVYEPSRHAVFVLTLPLAD